MHKKFNVFNQLKEEEIYILDNPKARIKHYFIFRKIAWIRAKQIPKAIKYKNIILQRSLFPHYPLYTTPVFEKILRKQSNNIILDILDPVHLWKPSLTFSTFKYVDKITVNTDKLIEDFKLHFDENKITNWPISIDFENYISKNISKKIEKFKLIYTGSKGNVISYLNPIIPTLEKFSEKYNIELIVVGSYSPSFEKLKIKHFNGKWNLQKI